jgi:hypothetical protein
VPIRRCSSARSAKLAGAGVAGVVGFASVFGYVPTAQADTAPAGHAAAQPVARTAKSADSAAPTAKRTVAPAVTAHYGSQKYRVGVQLKDGSYAPIPAAPDTLTGDTTLTITETGPNAPDAPDNTVTCTTSDATQDPNSTRTWCESPNLPGLAALRKQRAQVSPHAVTRPTPDTAPGTEEFVAAPHDKITIRQTTVRPNLVKDTSTVIIKPCTIDPSQEFAICFKEPGNPDSGVTSTDAIFEDTGLPPVATDDSASTPYDTSKVVDVLANDDAHGAPIKKVSVHRAPGHGSAHAVSTSSGPHIRYVPANGFVGTDTFTYTLTTANGSSTATVRVDVAPPRPAAKDDSASTTSDQAVTIDVTRNDNPRGRTITQLHITSQPKHGSAHVVHRSGRFEVRYTPQTGFTGMDTFPYSFTTDGGTASATVRVDVAAPAPAPAAVDDSASTQSGTPVTVHVTSNDKPNGGGALVITSTGTPSHGTVRINGHNVVYTPAGTYTGPDSFTYTVHNSNGSATATVHITVTSSGVLADTGVDSQALLELGGMLLVTGGAASVLGGRRRRGRHAGA